MKVIQKAPVFVFFVMVIFLHGPALAAPLINSHEMGDRAPARRYEEDRTIAGDQGESTTLSFRLALFGDAGADLPLVVQVHAWGSNFADQEDIARWSPAAYDFMMLYFQYKPSTGNEDDWWFGTHWGGECRMWAHEAVMGIVREVISGSVIPTNFSGVTIDPDRVYMFGHSIGGTGAWQLGLRNPDVFAAVHAHSGFARFTPPVGPFQEQFELDIVGAESEGVVITGDDGSTHPARSYSDLSWWLTNYKDASYETPFVFATHGTGDDTVPAASGGDLMRTVMDEQHRGFSYYRHPGGHSDENFIRLNWMWNFRKNQSFLSFTSRSGYGVAPAANGVINDLTAFYWDPATIVDQSGRYEVQISGSGTANVTLRRLQNFNASPNSSYRFWLNQETGEGAPVQTGADGLLTIPSVPGGALLIVAPDGGAPPLDPPEQENPAPSLTVNGSGQSAQVTAGDAFQLSASMDAGDYGGENADWWIVYTGGEAPYSLTAQGWVPVLDNILTLPLANFSSIQIPPPTLQPGAYTIYFAVDLVPDGQLSISSLFFDAAAITVSPPDAPDNGPVDGPAGRIMPDDLVYRGSFAFPAGEEWTISGHAMTFYPDGDPNGANDGHPGSLYAAGNELQDLVGEISIPSPSMSRNFDDLPKATVLRPLTDITGGLKDNCTFAPGCLYREVDGLAYLPDADKIAWNLREWYGVEGYDMDSLGWSELDMTAPRGLWHIGSREDGAFHYQKTCDYLFTAPESFAETWLEGKRLIAGNQNEAGANGGSQGPSFVALAPWEDGDPPAPGQPLDALALVYYPEIYECVWEDPAVCHYPDYRAIDNWGGAVWAFTAEQSAILVSGRKGLGDNCYGEQSDCGNDPCSVGRGYHSWPYETQIIFYDPEDFKDVISDSAQPWEVLPYEVYSPSSEVFNPSCGVLGAAAYDDENHFLYIAEKVGGPRAETVVHVWEIE